MLLFCLAIGCIFIPVWVYFQFPDLMAHFSTAIPGGLIIRPSRLHTDFFGGDHIQVFYYGWKLKENLLNGISPFIDPYTFAARGHTNVDLLMGTQYQTIALWQLILGDVAGYNFANFIFAPMVTFVGAFLLIRLLTPQLWFCFFGALAITFVPYRWVQMAGGHSGGLVHMLLPYYFYGIFRHHLRPQSRGGALLAGIMLFAITISDEHQGYYLVLVSMFIFITWFLQAIKYGGEAGRPFAHAQGDGMAFIKRWGTLIAGLILTLGYGALLDRLVLSSPEGGAKFHRTYGEIKRYSHALDHFFPLIGMNTGSILLYFLILCLLARVIYLIWKRQDLLSVAQRLLASPYLGLSIALPISLVTMVGIGKHWSQNTGIYELFYHVLPYFKYQRVPGKIFGVVIILLVMLTAHIFETNRQKSGVFYRCIANVALAAMLTQVLNFGFVFATEANAFILSDMTWEPTPVTAYMRTQTSMEDLFLMVPATEGTGGRYTTLNYYWAYKTRRRFSSGYSGNPPIHFMKSRKYLTLFNEGHPDRKALEVAREDGVTYLLLAYEIGRGQEGRSENLVEAYKDARFVQTVVCDGGFCLYKMNYDPEVVSKLANPGWTVHEKYRGSEGRWMRSGGDVPNWFPEDYKDRFCSISHVSLLDKKTGVYDITFWPWKDDFSLWVLEPGKEPKEFPAPWQKLEDGWHVMVDISSPEFVLATENCWNLRDRGHFDDLQFGHFVVSPK